MNLLIVESPSKAKTIEKYLGAGWRVIASVGHVRDLVPENGSVDTENKFKMRWQIMPGTEKQIKLSSASFCPLSTNHCPLGSVH